MSSNKSTDNTLYFNDLSSESSIRSCFEGLEIYPVFHTK